MVKIKNFFCAFFLTFSFVNNVALSQNVKNIEKNNISINETDIFDENNSYLDSPILKKKIVLQEMSPGKKLLIKMSNPLLKAYIYIVVKYRICKSYFYKKWENFKHYFFSNFSRKE